MRSPESAPLEDRYHHLCSGKDWHQDPAQEAILQELKVFLDRIHPRFLSWLRPKPYQGVYIWGPVGRGKTTLVDLAYEVCVLPKKRFHFYHFMAQFHALRHDASSGAAVSVEQAVSKMFEGVRLLVLDEFQVTHIADAMILKSVFQALTRKGIYFLITSNTQPSHLYQGGLNRDRFMPFVEWLLKHARVLSLLTDTDYRLQHTDTPLLPSSFSPHSKTVALAFQQMFQKLTGRKKLSCEPLLLSSQTLECLAFDQGVVYTTFQALCDHPLGAPDYLALAQKAHVLMVQGIPLLVPSKVEALERWMMLVDIWYDHQGILITSSEKPYAQLVAFGDTPVPERWARVRSRLHECERRAGSYLYAVQEGGTHGS